LTASVDKLLPATRNKSAEHGVTGVITMESWKHQARGPHQSTADAWS
jgi:hypothetical protein